MSDANIIWITNPDNYDVARRPEVQPLGRKRMELFAGAGLTVRVVHACDLVAASSHRPHLWHQDEDLLDHPRGYMLSAWPWDPGTGQHFRAISRSIRASTSVLLNDGIRDPERLGLDKLAMAQHAAAVGIPVLPVVAVPFGRYARRAIDVVTRSLATDTYIVKPREMATGFGVVKAQGLAHLRACLDLITPGPLGCLVQPYFPNTGDLRVYVHGKDVVAGMLRRPAQDDYLANLTAGGSLSTVDVSPEIAELSVRLATSLDAGYLAVDWLVDDERGQYVLNEWMTIAASFEALPEPALSRVLSALTGWISDQLAAAGALGPPSVTVADQGPESR